MGQPADIAIIVPVLNEREQLPELVEHVESLQPTEIVFVDGGSTDGSWQWFQQHSPQYVVKSKKGRGAQMNAGADKAEASVLLFLHADTRLPDQAIDEIKTALQSCRWGRFNVQFAQKDWRMRVIAFFMNHRSSVTSIATGDQALFIQRKLFEELGGFSDIPIMEDIDFCKRLKAMGCQPYCSELAVTTSARRWLSRGVIRTVVLMWWLRLAYFFGAKPKWLARQYRQIR